MARGLLSGALSVGLGGLLCALSAIFLPMWVVSRTESGNSFCWKGFGLWAVDADWGSKVDDLGLKCGNSWFGETSTYSRYCSDSSSDSDKRMCTYLTTAKAFSILVLLTCTTGIILNIIALTPGCLRRIYSYKLNSVSYSRLGAIFLILSAMLLIAMFGITMFSPLFSQETYKEVSGKSDGAPTSVGCTFDSPVSNPLHLLRSNALTCVFPGPSFALCLVSCLLLICSGAMLLKYHLEFRKVESRMLFDNAIRPVNSMTRLQELVTEKRRYSLYGALKRYYTGKWVFVSYLLPISAMISSIMFLVWTFFGEQYFLAVTLDYTKHKRHETLQEGDFVFNFDGLTSQGFVRDKFINETMALLAPLGYDDRVFYFKNTMSDFSPIITIKTLWEQGSRIFPFVIFCSLGFFPYARSICWLWMFFVPMDEVLRGRILTLVDVLGKYTLGNIFLIGLVGMGQAFEKKVSIPLPFGGVATLTLRETFSTGFSTNGFVIACVYGMVVGTLFVRVHGRAAQTESNLRESIEQQGNGYSRAGMLSDRLLSYQDTPYADGYGVNMGYGRRNRGNRNRGENSPWVIGEEFDIEDEAVETDSSTNHSTPIVDGFTDDDNDDTMVSVELSPGKKISISRLPLYKRKFSPIPGKRHAYSTRGILLVFLGLFTTTVLLCCTLFLQTYAFKRFGLTGALVIPEDQHYTKHTIMDFATVPEKYSQDVVNGGSHRTATASWLSLCFITFAVVFPFLHIVAMGVAFCWPMDIYMRRRWFSLIETIQAWTALDAFLVSMVVAWHDMEAVTTTMCSLSLPNLDELARLIGFHSMFTVHLYIPLFWVIVLFVLMEKIMGHVVVHQFAQLLSEDEGRIKAHMDDEAIGRAEEDRALEGAMAVLSPSINKTEWNGLNLGDD